MGLPHPGGLTVPNPPWAPSLASSSCGAVVCPLAHGGCPHGAHWALPLSFWGPVAPPGSLAVRVWLGGFGLCCCRPRPGL